MRAGREGDAMGGGQMREKGKESKKCGMKELGGAGWTDRLVESG